MLSILVWPASCMNFGQLQFSKLSRVKIAGDVVAGVKDGTKEKFTDERTQGFHFALFSYARPLESALQKSRDVQMSQRQ